MAYAHNLFYTNSTRSVTSEEFNCFAHLCSEILVKWYRQHSTAADTCLDLSSREADFRPSDIGHNDCILRILRSAKTDAEKIVRLDTLWQNLSRVLINATRSNGISIPRVLKCDWYDDLRLVFTKTGCLQPFDELCVAVYTAAQQCSPDWNYTSDGDDELLAAGRALAGSVFEHKQCQCRL